MKLIKTLLALQVAVLFFLSIPVGAAPPLPRGAEIKVSTSSDTWHYGPSVAAFPDGGFVVVFIAGPRTDQDGRRVIHARLLDSQGRPTSGQFRLTDPVAGSQFVNHVVTDRDGSFLISWEETLGPGLYSPRRVFVRRFNRDGTPRGKRILVHSPSRLSRSRGVVTIAPDGRLVVAWLAEVQQAPGQRYGNAMARILTAEGAPLTDEFLVLEGGYGIGDDTIYPTPVGLAVGSDGTLNVLVQTFELPDIVTTELVRVAPEGGTEVLFVNSTGCCLLPDWGASLAMGRDGSLMVTWTEERIKAKRFTPEGDEANQFIVNPRFTENQSYPAIAQHADGSFVIAWTNEDGEGSGIFGRTFSADGTPLTRRLRINRTVAGDQRLAAIAASPQGPVLVVWDQIAEDRRAHIYARLLR